MKHRWLILICLVVIAAALIIALFIGVPHFLFPSSRTEVFTPDELVYIFHNQTVATLLYHRYPMQYFYNATFYVYNGTQRNFYGYYYTWNQSTKLNEADFNSTQILYQGITSNFTGRYVVFQELVPSSWFDYPIIREGNYNYSSNMPRYPSPVSNRTSYFTTLSDTVVKTYSINVDSTRFTIRDRTFTIDQIGDSTDTESIKLSW